MKRTGKLLCAILTLIIIVSLSTAALADPYTGDNAVFTDVDPNSQYASYIYDIYERGITKGTSETTFAPLDKMTRAQFVTFIGRLAGVDMSAYSKCPFTDVTSIYSWATPYISWAYELKITNGTSETTFNPGDFVTREQMATFMCRFADAYGIILPESYQTPTDVEKVSEWAKKGVSIFGGFSIDFDAQGRFNPQDRATRQEMAKVLSMITVEDPADASGNTVIINGVSYTLEPTDKSKLQLKNGAGYIVEYKGRNFTRVYNQTIPDEAVVTIKCADGKTSTINGGQLKLAMFVFYVNGNPVADSYDGAEFISRFGFPAEDGANEGSPLKYVTEIIIK